MNKKQIVNIITGLRVVLLPLIYVLLAWEKRQGAALLLIIAGFTDVLDGALARYWMVANRNGAVWDGCADYLYYTSYIIWIIWLFPQVIEANKLLVGSVLVLTFVLLLYMCVKKGGLLFGHFLLSRVSAVCSFVMMTLFLWGFVEYWVFQIALVSWICADVEILLFLKRRRQK